MDQMKNIGLIPLRKDSKGILGKNKKKFLGRPLFSWVLCEAAASSLDHVYVFTNDVEIIDYINLEYDWSVKISVLQRNEENANDTASTESALLEFSSLIDWKYDSIFLLQATSVFTTTEDIDKAIDIIDNTGKDSVLSVVRTHRFIWDENGNAINYDPMNRPRRQDFKGLLVENGAIYGCSVANLKNRKNRLGEHVGLLEMTADSYHEIDDASDWEISEVLMRRKLKSNLQKIKLLVLDVDGVFTNGTVAFDQSGELLKTFDMRDGMGLEILRASGVDVMVLTSENSAVVASRMKKLKIENVHMGVKDKYGYLSARLNSDHISWSQVAYVGDDVNDLSCLLSAGLSMTPNDAMKEVQQYVDFILHKSGGKGAIREAVEMIMKNNKRYEV